MKIYILGLGAGSIDIISKKGYELLKKEDIKKIFRTKEHEIIHELAKENIEFETMDYVYLSEPNFESVYEKVSDIIIEKAKQYDEIVYAVPGSPFITEDTTNMIIKKAQKENIEVQIIPSVSFIDAVICAIKKDPTKKLYITDIFNIDKSRINPLNNIMISQVYDRFKASELKLMLMDRYNDDQEIYIITSAGGKDEKVKTVKLYEMDYSDNEYSHLTSVFIESVEDKKYNDIEDLRNLLRTLRGKNGCPWDKKQDFSSMAKYVKEEANEVADAINNNDMDNLLEELGDLLFEIVFLTNLAEEKGIFSFEEVVDEIVKKMIRRHPHVFENMDISGKNVEDIWQEIKNIEKQPKNS